MIAAQCSGNALVFAPISALNALKKRESEDIGIDHITVNHKERFPVVSKVWHLALQRINLFLCHSFPLVQIFILYVIALHWLDYRVNL